MRPLIARLLFAGLFGALVAAAVGRSLERARFGATDDEALARVESELRQRFAAAADGLGAIATRVGADRTLVREASRDQASAARLFDVLTAAIADEQTGRTGITIYNSTAASPIAWAGRAADLPKERIGGPAALFVAPGALGPRLIRVEPLGDQNRRGAPRQATIVVEQSLAGVQRTPAARDTFVVPTTLAPVSIRTAFTPAGRSAPSRYAFAIPSPNGGSLLVEAEVAPADLADARARWRSRVRAVIGLILATTLLLCTGPLLDLRRATRTGRVFTWTSVALVALLGASALTLWAAAAAAFGVEVLASQLRLLLAALTTAGIVALFFTAVERRRTARPRPPLVGFEASRARVLVLLASYVLAGLADAWVFSGYERLLQRVVSTAALDVLHFSLHPLSVSRLAVAFGLVVLHASVIWGGAALIRVAGLMGRVARHGAGVFVATGGWVLGAAAGVGIVLRAAPSVPQVPLLAGLGAIGLCAASMAQYRARARHASQAVRLAGLFLALLLPAVVMYPSLVTFASDAKEQLVANQYGPLILSQRDDLKSRLQRALDQIDAMRTLGELVAEPRGDASEDEPAAFAVWSKTDLAEYRITSAIELYDTEGRRVSRFALNLPEYSASPYQTPGCGWNLIDEPPPFGSSVRHVLTASRGICEHRAPRGSVVVRVMLDYTTLPFISEQSPYLASLRSDQLPAEGAPGRDIEFAVYGWSRAPIYASGTSVWPVPDPMFARTVASRDRFWATLTRDDQQFRVYFMNDRGGIYLLGYPVITWFGHLVNLAELVVLTGVLFIVLLVAATIFHTVASRMPVSGRALLRELRASFYWKVFLLSLIVAILPVVILAVATRAFFAKQLEGGIDEAAAKTATVAQRLVEDYASLQPRAANALAAIDDPIMMLVGRAIDQDVNLYDRTELQATSQADLFASGLLSRRTPGLVYERIILERLPTFVNVERVGDFSYLVAAAPVRAGGRDGIVTVPLPLRRQEIERQIDDLDRQVVFAAVLFSLVGAAIGYWTAERIADPVSRLTHATRRIARGDFDARIASAASDELGRLVHDFNRMADDLKRQRTELERTQRLEAWAEMARQVAHDIKNPLTPIQLSAEHVRRVNLDSGRPLSPVLDDCVTAILTQVALLRQIAAEFSSFASSPTAKPAATPIRTLIDETIEPYRSGLTGRVLIDVDTAADLPDVMIDRTLVARAIINVVENALHAMPSGGTLLVRSRAAAPEPQVSVEITDTGIGLDQDALKRIFEPYFSTKATGTGLGLTIAKRNIELSGGTIHVTSQRGVGTTVTIALPVA